MIKLKVSENNDYLMNRDRKFFYLGDTVWSTFTNASEEEWAEYLEYRSSQGFNALQINILPQWDASEPDFDIKPFKVKEDGSFDFDSINEEYFKRAERLVKMAVDKGFVPALVLLWLNYVKDTWGSDMNPRNIMPFDSVEPYVRYVAGIFSKYNPIYLISGDTDFRNDVAKSYYSVALNTIKEASPHCLTTMHLSGCNMNLPEDYINNKNLDFYMYQSGHGVDSQAMPYIMAEDFSKKSVKRPVLNGEPCYEGIGFAHKYGRFTSFNIRKATWQSLLSGANVGITYGAHGIWNWYKQGKGYAAGEVFDKPYDWRKALRLRGSWDVAYAKWIFETYDLFDVNPMEKILNETKEIRIAGTADYSKVAIYVPYNTIIKVDMDLTVYDLNIIDLEDKHVGKPSLEVENGVSVIDIHDFNSDVLIVGVKIKHH
jgi:hypothetical protein